MRQVMHPVGFLLTVIVALGAISATAQVSLVRDGESRAVVVTADDPSETARYAAQELVRHVQLATGVTLSVVSESELPHEMHTGVYIGETRAAERHGIDVARLPRETYVMRSVGNDLFIAGREDDGDPLRQDNPNAGTLFGAYEFLERYLGARWLWPGELGTYMPATDTVEFPSVNETTEPALVWRGFYWGMTQGIADGGKLSDQSVQLGFSQDTALRYAKAVEVLLRRHRMGGLDRRPPTGHFASGWWRRFGDEHPEWFALRRDGVRGHPDKAYEHVPLCVSNEELQDFIVETWDGEGVLRLGPVDRPGSCMCQNCQAWDGPQPDLIPSFARMVYKTDHRAQDLFAGATSDRYARFWKVIQEKASKRNPHPVVSASFIYHNQFPAPVTGIKLNNRFYGDFVQWQDPHLRWFPMTDEAYAWVKEQWLGWRETGMRLGYRPNYLHDGYVMPHFETRQSGEFFKFAYDHGMEGAQFDSLTGQWAVQGLRLYMHLRLMCKPELQVEAIRAEYFSAFGPAAGTMRRYYDYWEGYAFENTIRLIDLFRDVGWRYSNYMRRAHVAFPPECFEPAEALLDQALEETRGHPEEFSGRVKFIQIGLNHARLTTAVTALYDGQKTVPEDRLEKAQKTVAELVGFRKDNESMFFSDLLWVTDYWERNRLDMAALLAQSATD